MPLPLPHPPYTPLPRPRLGSKTFALKRPCLRLFLCIPCARQARNLYDIQQHINTCICVCCTCGCVWGGRVRNFLHNLKFLKSLLAFHSIIARAELWTGRATAPFGFSVRGAGEQGNCSQSNLRTLQGQQPPWAARCFFVWQVEGHGNDSRTSSSSSADNARRET